MAIVVIGTFGCGKYLTIMICVCCNSIYAAHTIKAHPTNGCRAEHNFAQQFSRVFHVPLTFVISEAWLSLRSFRKKRNCLLRSLVPIMVNDRPHPITAILFSLFSYEAEPSEMLRGQRLQSSRKLNSITSSAISVIFSRNQAWAGSLVLR